MSRLLNRAYLSGAFICALALTGCATPTLPKLHAPVIEASPLLPSVRPKPAPRPAAKAPAEAQPLARGLASYYAKRHQGRRTASGERLNTNDLTGAHPNLPFGSKVRVTNLANDRSVVVRINDRGPFGGKRVIDVSRKAAEQLGMLRAGTAQVQLTLEQP